MTLIPGADGGLPVGAFMAEGLWQSQPTRAANKHPRGAKLPLSGTHDTSWPMNERDQKPRFRRGGGKGPDRGHESGRRPPWRDRSRTPIARRGPPPATRPPRCR